MATFTVNTTDDVISEDDFLSLREALIEAANNGASLDTINFDAELLGPSATITLDGLLGELEVDSNVEILGLGAEQLTIDAAGNSRVFDVDDNSAAVINVTISGLTITGGSISGGFPSGVGGGVANVENLLLDSVVVTGNTANVGGGVGNGADGLSIGTLTITNSQITGNAAVEFSGPYSDYGVGGGVANGFGIVTIEDSLIDSNTADEIGGGTFNGIGSMTISRSTISNNQARTAGGSSNYAYVPSGMMVPVPVVSTLTIEQTKITDNIASNVGGGIENFAQEGAATTTITESTISGNTAEAFFGGGINNFAGANGTATVNVFRSTLSENSAASYGGAVESYAGGSGASATFLAEGVTIGGNTAGSGGGAVDNYGSGDGAASATFRNVTIAFNTAGSSGGGISTNNNVSGTGVFIGNTLIGGNVSTGTDNEDVSGTFDVGTEDDRNIVEDTTGGTFNGDVLDSGDVGSINAIIEDTLANNGGLTLTYAQQDGSPATGAGSNAPEYIGSQTFDQRGEGFPRLSDGVADIGAIQNSEFVFTGNLRYGLGSRNLNEVVTFQNEGEQSSTILRRESFSNTGLIPGGSREIEGLIVSGRQALPGTLPIEPQTAVGINGLGVRSAGTRATIAPNDFFSVTLIDNINDPNVRNFSVANDAILRLGGAANNVVQIEALLDGESVFTEQFTLNQSNLRPDDPFRGAPVYGIDLANSGNDFFDEIQVSSVVGLPGGGLPPGATFISANFFVGEFA
ncbi:MAG: choice-of-anchor Q domain-containing protein [Cyanobacteria bacterium P01_H01_bin.15]